MEIDVTDFCSDPDRLWDVAHSAAEEGVRHTVSGARCWVAALEAAEEFSPVTAENREEIEDWLGGFGAWERSEIGAMSDLELGAMVLQFVAGDARSRNAAIEDGELAEWEESEGGRLYESNGRMFFYIGI